MNKQDQLEELLVDWELQRRQGDELSVDEICSDSPELAPELTNLIQQFKATDWLEEDDDSDDDFLHLPDFSTMSPHAEETRLPECSLSIEEFCQRLISSRLMDEEQVGHLRKRISANDARSFAIQLVSEKQMTRFQATVLLEGRDLPLVLDRYVLLGEIGAGGMGAVYKALHQQMDRVVALKILPKESVDSPDKVKRFQREVKVAAKLEHPNIVPAFDAHESKGIHYLVMSYVNGSDLSDTVRKQGPVSAAKAVSYITQAASGLEHAHNIGIVHRDIKPGNLLLDKKGKVQILDMGLARIENSDAENDKTVSQELTQTGMVMGTIAYLAPEQALDTRDADGRSDIYSLGCTLYYLLNGKAPYIEDTIMKTIMAHHQTDIPSLCDERKNVPVELDAIFQKMVAKQREDRFQSMTEVISALEELEIEDDEEAQPVVAVSPAMRETATCIDTSLDVIASQPEIELPTPPKRRWPLIASGMLGVIVLLAGLIIKLQTPAGMVILEVDQPELIGAVVTIDGEKKITIKIGKGKEPIEITPDEKRHELEIKIAGFKTFAKDFTFETGDKQTIKVRLEPLKPQVAKAMPVTAGDYVWPKDQPAPAIAPFNAEEAKAHQEEWAKHLGTEVETTNSIGMKFRVIPPGEFLMGSSEEEIAKWSEEAKEQKLPDVLIQLFRMEGPQHKVTLTKPFGLAAHEVTRGQFRQFVDATGYKTDAEKDGKGGHGFKDGKEVYATEFLWNTNLGFETEQSDDHPVVNVSWDDAVAFCEWLSEKEGVTYRLPTEAEWEFACRAGSLARFSFGNEESKLGEYAWYRSQGGINTKPVGKKAANALGLFDLHGNGLELCGDWLGPYEAGPAVNPLGPEVGSNRLLRGGSFIHRSPFIRSALRLSSQPSNRAYIIGFRVVRDFEPSISKLKTTHIWPKDQPVPAIAPFSAEVETTNSIGMEFRVIPPGEFLMGSSDEEITKLQADAKEQERSNDYIEQVSSEGQHNIGNLFEHSFKLFQSNCPAFHPGAFGHFKCGHDLDVALRLCPIQDSPQS